MTLVTDLPALTAAQLHHTCDPHQFDFQTTAELEDLGELIGQMRAMEAVQFGTGMRHEGYNIYVQGPSGMGKRSMVQQLLARKTPTEADPPEWCYLHNFKQPHKPQALSLPPGRGADLRDQMAKLVDYLRSAIPGLFESDEYRATVSYELDLARRDGPHGKIGARNRVTSRKDAVNVGRERGGIDDRAGMDGGGGAHLSGCPRRTARRRRRPVRR